jgi:hypothetical protein
MCINPSHISNELIRRYSMRQEIQISPEVEKGLTMIAQGTGISPIKCAEIIVQAFVEGEGKLFVGKWKEGPGLRVLPDWPRFSSCIIKVKSEELKGGK